MEPSLLYFANPMCSWCWGFQPSMLALTAKYPELKVVLATGTMGSHRAKPMTSSDRAQVQSYWKQVESRSGQPFNHAFFERDGFVYDTQMPCKALVVFRQLYAQLTLPFFYRLQEMFYTNNRDITDLDQLAAIATDFGLEAEAFKEQLKDPQVSDYLIREWRETEQMGVGGYPTLLILGGGAAEMVSHGWCTPENLLTRYETAREGLTAKAAHS